MGTIAVSGLINIEVTLSVDSFPVPYYPVRYAFGGVGSTVSGVGYNVAVALSTLGDEVRLLSLAGRDGAGRLIEDEMKTRGMGGQYVVKALDKTPHSVIVYDGNGRRQIHLDLKDIQDQAYDPVLVQQALKGCDLAVLCNINFSRPMLSAARNLGIPIATDVHVISSLDDEYNRDFMEAADILFMSDEHLPCPPAEWLEVLCRRYNPEIAAIGMGDKGALLYCRSQQSTSHFPVVQTRPVVNTIGAGDALFSAFVHFYHRTGNPRGSMARAMLFASWKTGSTGAAEGFLTEEEIESLRRERM